MAMTMNMTAWPHVLKLKSGEQIIIRPIEKSDFLIEARFIDQLSEQSKYFRFMKVVHKVSDETVKKFTEFNPENQFALIAVTDRKTDDLRNIDFRKADFRNTVKFGNAVEFGKSSEFENAVDIENTVKFKNTAELRKKEFDLNQRNNDDFSEVEIGVARFVKIKDQSCCEFAIVVADAWQGSGIGNLLMTELIQQAQQRGLICMKGDVFRINAKMIQFVKSLGFQIIPCADDARFVEAFLKLTDSGVSQ